MVYPPWNTPFDQWASDPDAQSYAEDLLFYAAPLLVAALLLPLIVCITLCCRKRCCGASKAPAIVFALGAVGAGWRPVISCEIAAPSLPLTVEEQDFKILDLFLFQGRF